MESDKAVLRGKFIAANDTLRKKKDLITVT